MTQSLVQITPSGEQIDLNEVFWLRTIADRIKEAFDANVLAEAEKEGYRTHLGASVIGNECARYLYYHFRWFKKEIHSARMHRIFGQGHAIEAQIRALLTACGAEFIDTVDTEGKQLRFSDFGGHFGGSVDGLFRWPAIGLVNAVLLECKSKKTGSPFNSLVKDGVEVSEPRHFAQQSVYGKAFNITHACYITYNKNDSSIYVEIVELSTATAEEMRNKALQVITTKVPPPRLSNKETFWICKMCSLWGVCHKNDAVVPNCRNCKYSEPADNAEWVCNKYQQTIPKEFIPQGCASHELLPR